MGRDEVMANTFRLNPTVKAAWVKALRSGDFIQGKSYLERVNKDGKHTFCCLGVLAKDVLHVPARNPYGNTLPAREGALVFDYGHGEQGFSAVPHSLIPSFEQGKLCYMNDQEEKSFEEIADWIEVHL